MLKAVTITREQSDGKYIELLDVAELLSDKYGTAVNAIWQLVRHSPEFVEARGSQRKKVKGDVKKTA